MFFQLHTAQSTHHVFINNKTMLRCTFSRLSVICWAIHTFNSLPSLSKRYSDGTPYNTQGKNNTQGYISLKIAIYLPFSVVLFFMWLVLFFNFNTLMSFLHVPWIYFNSMKILLGNIFSLHYRGSYSLSCCFTSISLLQCWLLLLELPFHLHVPVKLSSLGEL